VMIIYVLIITTTITTALYVIIRSVAESNMNLHAKMVITASVVAILTAFMALVYVIWRAAVGAN